MRGEARNEQGGVTESIKCQNTSLFSFFPFKSSQISNALVNFQGQLVKFTVTIPSPHKRRGVE
jgi:hypothetical protein